MGKYWFTLFCVLFALVYGIFTWHLIRWDDPYHGPYKMEMEKPLVLINKEKGKEHWQLEQCGNLKGHVIPCDSPVIIPVPSTLLLLLLPLIGLFVCSLDRTLV